MVAFANRVPWETTNDTPGTLVNHWTSKRGLKASVVTVVGSVSSDGSPVRPLEGLWCHSEYTLA